MVWKDIEEFKDYYQVSDTGDVRRISSGRVLKPKTDKDGYLEYCLCVNNVRTYRRGHRLVAQTFIPNPDNKPEVNHKNNIKDDNHIDNLEWVTDSENNRHYYKDYHTEGKGLCSLSKADWDNILELHRDNKSYKEISDLYNLDIKRTDTIGEVLKGNRLTSVTGFTQDMRNKDNLVSKTLTDNDVIYLLEDYHFNNLCNTDLVNKYKLSPAQVSRVLNGTRRKGIVNKFKEENNIE